MLLEFGIGSELLMIFGITRGICRTCTLEYVIFWRILCAVRLHLMVASSDVASPAVIIHLRLLNIDLV